MQNRSVEMYALGVPLDAIKKLSNEQRFAYYLLGHIFNELMCLQKLVAFALAPVTQPSRSWQDCAACPHPSP